MDQGLAIVPDRSSLHNDYAFDLFYPQHIRRLSTMHWTPLDVVAEVCDFLTSPGARILDVGSGAGKFCIAGGPLHPEAIFLGIKRRSQLDNVAEQLRAKTGAYDFRLLHGNVTAPEPMDYDHFYFYNSSANRYSPGAELTIACRLHRCFTRNTRRIFIIC